MTSLLRRTGLAGLATTLALASGLVFAQAPLPPQQVFPYEISADGSEILIEFDIADGAYLYRKEFSFTSTDGRVRLGAPNFPNGDVAFDEYLEETLETYRGKLAISIPYTRFAAVGTLDIEMELRGCDDNFGICYPPQDWIATVELADGPISTAGLAGSLFAGANPDIELPVDEAFIPNVRFDDANEMTVGWSIAPGYYLYRDQFSHAVDGEIQFGTARLPAGLDHTDESYGDTEIYRDYVEVVVPFARAHGEAQDIEITLGFQGCKDESICYPPSEQVVPMTLPASGEFDTAAAPAMVSEQDFLANLISNGSLWAIAGTFLVAGLGLSLTPCVYPMIPILSSIIAGQGEISRARSFGLSASYVLGMAVTYSAAGAITAMAGAQVQAVFQQPWIIVSVAVLFGIMALAMFGLFEIQMPTAIQSRLSALANKQKNGTFFGTAAVGALSALIVTTCVAPPLIGALMSIGQSGEVARGSFALFVLALGMGVPLLLIGASAGQLLPKVGPWMNTIKAGFGVVMIGMAVWMLERVLPGSVTLLLWALLIFLTGVFLGAFEALPAEPRPARRLAKGIGVLACLYGAILLIGSLLGGEDPFKPIPQFAGGGLVGQAEREVGPEFIDLVTVDQLEGLLAQASAAGQPVFVDFTADWCSSCKEMEEKTFPDAGVLAALAPYMLLRADVTDNDADDKALMEYYGTYGPPTMVFYTRAGEQVDPYRLVGFVEADAFATHVTTVASL